MRPLGARKTRQHCQNQRCAICRPCWPAKGGRAAEEDDSLDRDRWWPENAAERRLDAYEAERIAEKQASRDADAAALADGSKTSEQLRHENGLIRIARIEWANVRAPR